MINQICIFGHSGYIGSGLLKAFNKTKYNVLQVNIPRPSNNDNFYKFYLNFFSNFLDKNRNIKTIINCAGSIECKTEKDFFFNSYFDSICQKVILKKKIKLKYISLNSTKIFTKGLDNYALSKKNSNKKFRTNNNFLSVYIDLVFDKKSPHFNSILNVIKKFWIFPVPVFFPGKIFYPLNRGALVNFICKLINRKNKYHKFILLGDIKVYFYELILKVISLSATNKKLIYIKSSYINWMPSIFLNIILRSKFLQQYDDSEYIKKSNLKKYKIIKLKYKI